MIDLDDIRQDIFDINKVPKVFYVYRGDTFELDLDLTISSSELNTVVLNCDGLPEATPLTLLESTNVSSKWHLVLNKTLTQILAPKTHNFTITIVRKDGTELTLYKGIMAVNNRVYSNYSDNYYVAVLLKQTAPTISDNEYLIGTKWVNVLTNRVYFLTSVVNDEANWLDYSDQLDALQNDVEELDEQVDTHIEDLNNPHGVTAEQVDTYVKTTIDNKDANTLQEAKDYTYSQVEIDNKDTAVLTEAKEYTDDKISGVFRPSGNWNANTNTPTLANNEPSNEGKVYYVTNAGTQFGLTFAIGDKLAFIEGGVATKWDNVDDVTSVNGKVGTVVINADDIPFDGSGTNYLTAKTEIESAVKELDTRVKANADDKQDKLIAGNNIIIDPITNVISYSVIPPRYVQTTSADFNPFSGDYTGTEEYIILPADKPLNRYRIRNLNVKGVATNGDYLTSTESMFDGNTSLYLELDYLDTSNVTNMQSMFFNSQATTLDVSNFNTSNVTNMRSMFRQPQATELDLSSFDTSNVTDMRHMFQASQATLIDLSSFDTSNVTDMSYMFAGSQVTELDLSSFGTSNVTGMNFMFSNYQATELDLSSFDTSNVTGMNSMFQGSPATTGYARTQTDADNFNSSSDKPSTLTFVVKEDTHAGKLFNRVRVFNDNNQLVTTQILYEGEKVDKIVGDNHLIIKGTYDTFDMDSLVYSDLDLVLGAPLRYVQTTSADFDKWGDYTGTEEYIILPADKPDGYSIWNENVKGVATNGNYLTSTVNMFSGSPILYLELDYLDTSNVTHMTDMFKDSQATTLDLSNFDTSNVTNMQSMFQGSKATTLDLSNFDTSSVTNMNSMFDGSQVTTLDLSSFDTSNAGTIRWMFRDSQATTGYARTQTDADNFNNSSEKPSTLTFVVK